MNPFQDHCYILSIEEYSRWYQLFEQWKYLHVSAIDAQMSKGQEKSFNANLNTNELKELSNKTINALPNLTFPLLNTKGQYERVDDKTMEASPETKPKETSDQNAKETSDQNAKDSRQVLNTNKHCDFNKASPEDYFQPKEVLTDCQNAKDSTVKKQKFYIITERKLKPDAIFKKINKAFYNWIIVYLNSFTESKLKFIKVSKQLIKMIKQNAVKAILNQPLHQILIRDGGSEKYKNRNVNKENLQALYSSNAKEFKALKQFLSMPLSEIYKTFAKQQLTIKGPKYYVTLYSYLKDSYLDVFVNNDGL